MVVDEDDPYLIPRVHTGMIGRMAVRRPPTTPHRSAMTDSRDPLRHPELRYGLGCLVSGAALVGVIVLILVLFFVLSPPGWVQDVVGVLLAIGGAGFAWLVARSLGGAQTPRPGPGRRPRRPG